MHATAVHTHLIAAAMLVNVIGHVACQNTFVPIDGTPHF